MLIIKRDGSAEQFNWDKIDNVITKAFMAVDEHLNTDILSDIKDQLYFKGVVTVEDIQDQIEDALFECGYPKVGKAFIRYRDEHKNDRNLVDRIKYINSYINSSQNAATSSETDANANVTMKNVANLEGEVYKLTNRRIHRKMMRDKLTDLFPEVAKQYVKDLEDFIIYAHDESQSPTIKPYTYSSKEVVEVLYNSKSLLLPLDLLYDIVDEPEFLVDEENIVYQKYPWHMYIKDIDNKYTRVTVLTKKKRHRDLIRVKTAFGEDLVVTDNHPMITDINNINTTIEAKDSLGSSQYRVGTQLKFKGKDTIDFTKFLPSWINYTENFIKYQQSVLKRVINVDRKLGYIVGFFVGDGGYNNTNKCLDFSQKDKQVLDTINNYVYEVFGIAGTVQKESGHNTDKHVLTVRNQYVFDLFRNYFKIQDKAQNKTLPYNILEFNEEFAKGCLEGLIDSDGTIKIEDCSINIRLASRACILQCTYLFRHFGYSVGNGIQSLPFSNNSSYHTNYTIWGINATKREDSQSLEMSFKVHENLRDSKNKSLKYKTSGYCTITKLTLIEKESSFYDLNEFIYDITTETHTFCSNNILVHNCQAVTLYPMMLEGTKNIDGVTPTAPNDIQSFSGQVTNLMFLLSSQVRGAVAMGDYTVALNYYVIKEFGPNWVEQLDNVLYNNRTIGDVIRKGMKQYIYGINQPAGNRSYNSPFSNLNFFDEYYYKALFADFYYPDGTQPVWRDIDTLQRMFMSLLRELRLIRPLTFPVTTVCMLHDNEKCLDENCRKWVINEWAQGSSFFLYLSNNPTSISSCCRVANEITDNTFSSTTGLTGIMTGSANVITLNLNRIVQNWYIKEKPNSWEESKESFKEYLINILERVYKYQIAYKTMVYEMEEKGQYSSSNAGYISMKKLYCTIGIIGYCEAASFLGFEVSNNAEYKAFLAFLLGTIKEQNKLHSINDKKRPFIFNLEAIPKLSGDVKSLLIDSKLLWDNEAQARISCAA